MNFYINRYIVVDIFPENNQTIISWIVGASHVHVFSGEEAGTRFLAGDRVLALFEITKGDFSSTFYEATVVDETEVCIH